MGTTPTESDHKVPEAPPPASGGRLQSMVNKLLDWWEAHPLRVWLNDDRPWARTMKFGGLLLAAILVFWVGLAGLVSVWLARNPHNRVTYVDVALPWRWAQISDLQGQSYSASGLESLQAGRIQEGLFQLRQGLVRHPDDAAARLALARAYARAGYYRGVRETMLPQFYLSTPPGEFVQFFTEVAAQNDNHHAIVAVCDRVLTTTAAEPVRRSLLEKKTEALVALRNFPAALTILDQLARSPTERTLSLHAEVLIKLGRAPDALKLLRKVPGGAVAAETRARLEAAACAAAGRPDEMNAALLTLKGLRPTDPESWAEAIRQNLAAGRVDAARDEWMQAARRFDSRPAEFTRIALACADATAPTLVAACAERVRELGQPVIPILFDLTVTQLRAGDIAAAERTVGQILLEERRIRERRERESAGPSRSSPILAELSFGSLLEEKLGPRRGDREELPQHSRRWLEGLLAAATTANDSEADLLLKVLGDERLQIFAFDASAEVLARIGRWRGVQEVARRGVQRFPWSTRLRRWSGEAAEKLATMTVAAAPAEFRTAPAAIGSYYDVTQEAFLAQLASTVQLRDWAQAAAMVREVNRAGPEWLGRVRGDLDWSEIRFAFEENDRPKVFLLVAHRLATHPEDASRALELARHYETAGDAETARLLVKRILLQVPDHDPARTYLRHLSPAEAGAPAPVK